MRMDWHDLLFMHWPIETAALRPFVPPGLEIELFEGRAWLGVVPFRMAGVRPRLLPGVPTARAFPELNVRTYVRGSRGPGVWFFSLDAASRLAVWAARRTFGLAYMNAAMECRRDGDWVHYVCRRAGPRTTLAYGPTRSTEGEYIARYRPTGEPAIARSLSLESFLTDRYRLYAWAGRLLSAEIHHEPWSLQPAEARVEKNTMSASLGIDIGALDRAAGGPLLHFARWMPVVAWRPRPCGEAAGRA